MVQTKTRWLIIEREGKSQAFSPFFLNIPFSSPEFKIKKNVLIAIVIRDGQTIIPDGKSSIKCNDKVIVITKIGGKYNTLNDIFM